MPIASDILGNFKRPHPTSSEMVAYIGHSNKMALNWELKLHSQRVLKTNIGNTYPNHKGSYYYRNHTLYHVSTLDPLGLLL